MVITEETRAFIAAHADADVRKLALMGKRCEGIDMPFALDQIAGRQTARLKLPSWAATEGIIFPPHLAMEQCSSEATARYKASIAARFVDAKNCGFIDITGGFGVDFSYMAKGFKSATYIERQENLCELAAINLPLLGLSNATILNTDGEDYIKNAHFTDETVVFMDPARRDKNGGRTYAIGDCTPDVLGFIDNLLQKAALVIIKLSPMLDWHATVADLNRVVSNHDAVREVHIVATKNECKELLIVLSTRTSAPPSIHCVNDDSLFSFDERTANNAKNTDFTDSSETPKYLLVPNAAVMKAGCFRELELVLGIRQIAPSSHLFVSDSEISGFPGRTFQISAVSSLNKKELKAMLSGIERANISCRNFPLKPEELRKRLKIKDGGNDYIFATTTQNGDHRLYLVH